MSGAGPGRRAVSAAFGAAAAAAFVATGAGALLALPPGDGAPPGEVLLREASWVAPAFALAVAGGGGAGWLRAGALRQGGAGRHAAWGGGVALLGLALTAVLLGTGYAALLAYDAWAFESETGGAPVYPAFTLLGVLGVAVGGPLVLLPATVAFGAVAGWLVGRAVGTAAPPAR